MDRQSSLLDPSTRPMSTSSVSCPVGLEYFSMRRALYQLQLVPTEEAKKHIPSEFKIVDFMGYTLGGLYLARYSDSPVGVFDEVR